MDLIRTRRRLSFLETHYRPCCCLQSISQGPEALCSQNLAPNNRRRFELLLKCADSSLQICPHPALYYYGHKNSSNNTMHAYSDGAA